MKSFKDEVKSDLKMLFWTSVIMTILYIQGLGIQMLLKALGVEL